MLKSKSIIKTDPVSCKAIAPINILYLLIDYAITGKIKVPNAEKKRN